MNEAAGVNMAYPAETRFYVSDSLVGLSPKHIPTARVPFVSAGGYLETSALFPNESNNSDYCGPVILYRERAINFDRDCRPKSRGREKKKFQTLLEVESYATCVAGVI